MWQRLFIRVLSGMAHSGPMMSMPALRAVLTSCSMRLFSPLSSEDTLLTPPIRDIRLPASSLAFPAGTQVS